MFINDITSCITYSNIRLFADDTCLFLEVDDRKLTAEHLESDLNGIAGWADRWLVEFAPEKTKSLLISRKKDLAGHPRILFKNQVIDEIQAHTYLGLLFTSNLSWNSHIANVEKKARTKLNMLLPLKYKMDRYSLEKMFTAFVSSTMNYGVEVWGGSYDSHLLKLEQLIVDGMRLVTGATARLNISKLFRETCWSSFGEKKR